MPTFWETLNTQRRAHIDNWSFFSKGRMIHNTFFWGGSADNEFHFKNILMLDRLHMHSYCLTILKPLSTCLMDLAKVLMGIHEEHTLLTAISRVVDTLMISSIEEKRFVVLTLTILFKYDRKALSRPDFERPHGYGHR